MKKSAIGRTVVRHFFASLCAANLLMGVEFVVFAKDYFSSDGAGSPATFFLIPLMASLVGIAISVVAFLPLGLLAERFHFRWWLVVVTTLNVALVVILIMKWRKGIGPEMMGLELSWLNFRRNLKIFFLPRFFIYLCCLGCWQRYSPEGKK